jgi:hypothetical protein
VDTGTISLAVERLPESDGQSQDYHRPGEIFVYFCFQHRDRFDVRSVMGLTGITSHTCTNIVRYMPSDIESGNHMCHIHALE